MFLKLDIHSSVALQPRTAICVYRVNIYIGPTFPMTRVYVYSCISKTALNEEMTFTIFNRFSFTEEGFSMLEFARKWKVGREGEKPRGWTSVRVKRYI